MSVSHGLVYCKVCRKLIINPVPNQRYCSDECRKTGKEMEKEMLKWRKHNEYLKAKRKKEQAGKPKVKSISEIMKEATAEGLQYGHRQSRLLPSAPHRPPALSPQNWCRFLRLPPLR